MISSIQLELQTCRSILRSMYNGETVDCGNPDSAELLHESILDKICVRTRRVVASLPSDLGDYNGVWRPSPQLGSGTEPWSVVKWEVLWSLKLFSHWASKVWQKIVHSLSSSNCSESVFQFSRIVKNEMNNESKTRNELAIFNRMQWWAGRNIASNLGGVDSPLLTVKLTSR